MSAWLAGEDLVWLQRRADVAAAALPPEPVRARPGHWRICERCQVDLLVEPEYGDWLMRKGESAPPLLCPKCKILAQREEAARPVVPNARCVHVDYQRGPYSDLYIVKVEGDLVTVGVTGTGGMEPERQAEILERFHPGIMHGRRVFHRNELLMRGL